MRRAEEKEQRFRDGVLRAAQAKEASRKADTEAQQAALTAYANSRAVLHDELLMYIVGS